MPLETVINVRMEFIEALVREYQLPLSEVIIIARSVEIGVVDERQYLAEIIENVVEEYSIIYGCDGDKFIGQDRIK